MDSSISAKDEIWFLRVCHHISNALLRTILPTLSKLTPNAHGRHPPSVISQFAPKSQELPCDTVQTGRTVPTRLRNLEMKGDELGGVSGCSETTLSVLPAARPEASQFVTSGV